MSLAINTVTPEGIVLAADSRQSYRNSKGVSRVGSDSASKLFLINERVGVAITGTAFIPEDGTPKNISKFIEQFKREVEVENLSVKDIAEKLHYLFEKKMKPAEQLNALEESIKKDILAKKFELVEIKQESGLVKFKFKDGTGNIQEGMGAVDGLAIFVAGYNSNGSHEVYNIHIPGEIIKRRDSNEKGLEYGANWLGQTDVVTRIVKGWDPRIHNLTFAKEARESRGIAEVEKQLNGLEYSINWGAMPIQDAIDFSTLIIQTTEAIQRFSDGIQLDPGDIPGVGGPVDVLVLTPDGPNWIQKKELGN